MALIPFGDVLHTSRVQQHFSVSILVSVVTNPQPARMKPNFTDLLSIAEHKRKEQP